MSYGLVLMSALALTGQIRPLATQEAKEYWGKERLTLKKGELAKFARTGGMRGRSEEIVIREDGTVIQTIVQMGKPSKGSWKIAPKELKTLRAEIAATPFRKLRQAQRTEHVAAAVDGIDFLYVARQGKTVEWWSSGHWRTPQKRVKFFDRMQNLAPVAGG